MNLLVGNWKVTWLVQYSCDARIFRSRPVSVAVSKNVDHKLDLLAKELNQTMLDWK